MNRRRKLVWLAASILAVVLTPVLVHQALLWDHARGFHGICGPHAPDIQAHPCTYDEYMAEFGGGFAGVALLLIEGGALAVAVMLVSFAWLIAAWKARRET